jgi:hypothetical protein
MSTRPFQIELMASRFVSQSGLATSANNVPAFKHQSFHGNPNSSGDISLRLDFVERNFYLIPGKRFRSIRPIAEFNGIPGIAVTFIVPTWPGLSVQQAVGSQRKKFEWSSFMLATSKKRVGTGVSEHFERRASCVSAVTNHS